MRLAFSCILGFLITVTPALAQEVSLGAALKLVRAQSFDQAARMQAQLADPVAQDVVQWALLRAEQGSFEQARAFLKKRSDWPGLPLLRRKQEALIVAGASPEEVIRFFAPQAPQTGAGALVLSAALSASGKPNYARAALLKAWRTLPMTADTHAAFVAQHSTLLAPHHPARLDQMLWQGRLRDAERMLPLVSADVASLAVARMGLRAKAANVDGLIDAVAVPLRRDAGLAFERFLWRLTKGRLLDAADLIIERSRSRDTLKKPEIWAASRENLARQLMQEGAYQMAYRVASMHHLQEAEKAASLEWLSGYLALQKLGDAKRAQRHFTAFQSGVVSPISQGRAGYWLGRAFEAQGNLQQARASYLQGAAFQTSFYGQLAAERVAAPVDLRLTGGEVFEDWRRASFARSSVLRAALLLHSEGEFNLAERFITHLAEDLSRREIGQLIDIALAIQDHHIAVMLGKRAASKGYELHKGYFSVLPSLSEPRGVVPAALLLSIARRESEFNPSVTSHAGARGLMQVMPDTAEAMAALLGERYRADQLLSDPDYNARLGAAYLQKLIEEFQGSMVLVPAAYNAGPARARAWIERLGDPRDPNVDVVDWIEAVPFKETRNYIMRVSESLAIYRARLSGQTAPHALEKILKR